MQSVNGVVILICHKDEICCNLLSFCVKLHIYVDKLTTGFVNVDKVAKNANFLLTNKIRCDIIYKSRE